MSLRRYVASSAAEPGQQCGGGLWPGPFGVQLGVGVGDAAGDEVVPGDGVDVG